MLAALADEFPDSILLDIRRALIAVTTWTTPTNVTRRILNGIASALQRLIDRTTMDRFCCALSRSLNTAKGFPASSGNNVFLKPGK